ncbi:retrovirus-related pol polyprotein LINE-1 [Tanacetum coccineum]
MTVVGYFTFFGEKRRFGSPPPASGDSPLFSESDLGTLAASADTATGNHRRYRRGPPPLTGKFISPATAELFLFICYCFVPFWIEAVDSDGHLRSCPSGWGGVGGYRGTRSCYRVAGSRRIRVGSWNVGSLTNKLFELSDALGRHKVDIACFQETRWKGSRAREGNGYKLWYSGSSSARNGVGVVVAGRLKDDVVRVTRRSDRIMAISVVIDGEAVNVISAYAPQVGLSDAEKKRGDLNGHIGAAADGYEGVHGGFGFGKRNEEGRTILKFATAYDMVLANSLFKKRDLRACRDCRAFPRETCSSRHRLVIVDVLLGRRRRRREATRRPRILWKNLKGEAKETFRAVVSEKLTALEEDMSTRNADQMWNTLACVIRDVAKESLGVASDSARTHSTHRETWWFGEEVQTKVATKQSRFKELLACSDGNQEDIELAKKRCKVAKKEAKIAVAQAKYKAYKDLYRKLDSKEGANDIYKIAKARERKRIDIGNARYIKDEGGRTIVREEDIRKRWGEYFSSLFNESPPIESRPERSVDIGSSRHQMYYDCYYSRINQGEVRAALQRMGRNKAVGPDQIPIEAWRYLEDEEVKWLTCLFNKIFLGAKMPDEWRLSEVIPIYKKKGDVQACSNYRGIKLLSHTMKLWERVLEIRLRRETRVSENQFGFMSGWSTTEAIYLLRSLMEKYRERQRDLHMAFLDLEKAYDSVPQFFQVEVGLHQGSAISPYLFTLILDELSRGIQESIPWCMIFADDIVLIAESAEGLNNRIEKWREALEDNGLRVSREKTGYLRCNFGRYDVLHQEVNIRIGDQIPQPNESFRYLGSVIHRSRKIDEDVAHRIGVGTDIAKILRKRSKPDNHGHGNEIEYAKAGRMLSNVNKSQPLVNTSQLYEDKTTKCQSLPNTQNTLNVKSILTKNPKTNYTVSPLLLRD